MRKKVIGAAAVALCCAGLAAPAGASAAGECDTLLNCAVWRASASAGAAWHECALRGTMDATSGSGEAVCVRHRGDDPSGDDAAHGTFTLGSYQLISTLAGEVLHFDRGANVLTIAMDDGETLDVSGVEWVVGEGYTSVWRGRYDGTGPLDTAYAGFQLSPVDPRSTVTGDAWNVDADVLLEGAL